jgi:hypothetical protein
MVRFSTWSRPRPAFSGQDLTQMFHRNRKALSQFLSLPSKLNRRIGFKALSWDYNGAQRNGPHFWHQTRAV